MQRDTTVDVARGFTVFIMPAVHSVLTYSTLTVRSSALGDILGFLAEGPGAELFMLLMGFCITYGRKKNTKQILRRAFSLLALAYLLNFIKIILPLLWNGIPLNVFSENHIPFSPSGWWLLFRMGDILQLAGVAYLVCALLYKLPYFAVFSIGIGLIVTFLSPALWQIHSRTPLLSIPLDLLIGTPPRAFFPVFPWIAYPLFGLGMGYFVQNFEMKLFYTAILPLGLALIIAGNLLSQYEPPDWERDFYRLGPGGTLRHLGIALLWWSLCFWAVKCLGDNLLFKFLAWLSKNITVIYCLQWVIIFWLTPWFSYHHLTMTGTLFSICITSLLTFGLVFIMPSVLATLKRLCLQSNKRIFKI